MTDNIPFPYSGFARLRGRDIVMNTVRDGSWSRGTPEFILEITKLDVASVKVDSVLRITAKLDLHRLAVQLEQTRAKSEISRIRLLRT